MVAIQNLHPAFNLIMIANKPFEQGIWKFVPTNSVQNIVYKSTITNMAMLQKFWDYIW